MLHLIKFCWIAFRFWVYSWISFSFCFVGMQERQTSRKIYTRYEVSDSMKMFMLTISLLLVELYLTNIRFFL